MSANRIHEVFAMDTERLLIEVVLLLDRIADLVDAVDTRVLGCESELQGMATTLESIERIPQVAEGRRAARPRGRSSPAPRIFANDGRSVGEVVRETNSVVELTLERLRSIDDEHGSQ
jgi:hypothetical protein